MISRRTPVLAHERFLADRENFAGLDLAARFERIERTNLWGATTSVSGLGSEDPATAAIRQALPALLQRLCLRSLLDAPCGDAGWIGGLKLDVDYTGIDIVPSLIEANRRRVAGGVSPGRFLVADITRDALPRADIILCRDCLVHLSFANIDRALAQFRTSGARFLLVTTFPEWEINRDCEDGDWRALNMEKAPFDWPAPHALINERCEEGGGRLARQEPWAVAAGGCPMIDARCSCGAVSLTEQRAQAFRLRHRHRALVPARPVFGQGCCRLLALDGAPVVCIGSPGARSSGGWGLASPTVPGGASLLAVRVLTRSNVTVDATTMAMANATAARAKAARSFGSIARPPRDGTIVRG